MIVNLSKKHGDKLYASDLRHFIAGPTVYGYLLLRLSCLSNPFPTMKLVFLFIVMGVNCLPLFPQNITSNITFNSVIFELSTNLTIRGESVVWRGINSTVRCEGLGGLTFEEYLNN